MTNLKSLCCQSWRSYKHQIWTASKHHRVPLGTPPLAVVMSLVHNDDDEWWWIVFVVWFTNKRCLALFPAGIIVRDPHHRESPTRRKQVWTCAEPEFRLSWMKLCNSDNHHTTAPLTWQISLFQVTEGLLSSNLGSKSNSVIEVDRALLHWG